jgi:cytochrome c oxidase subunit 2
MVALAVVLVVLVIGSLIFHFASQHYGWYFTDVASNWGTIDTTVDITFWVCGIVFVAVNLFTAYCVWRFRARPGNKAHYEPESAKLEIALTAFTAVGVALMLTPGLFVWADFVQVPEDAATVEVVGKQWHWSFRLPGADNELGASDVRHMSVDNPLGVDPSDPAGQDDIIIASPILHLPLDQPVRTLLRSTDVLHNFTVTQFRVKMDLVPGLVTYQWFTPTVAGTYEILCEELCGTGHFAMRGKVVVDEPAAYQAWLANQPTFAQTQARPVGNAAAGQTTYGFCTACHGSQGEGNAQEGINAPKIAGLDSWYIRRQLVAYQTGVRASPLDENGQPRDPLGTRMPPMAQLVADPATRENVLAYIAALPNNPPTPTLSGDLERGRALYFTCSTCHGAEGQGRWGTNAPRLAGMSDWYLERQLRLFKSGLRGGHPDDIYGDQMNLVANVLVGENAIRDVVAYINTLR